ncbi:sulfotransferase [Candidatus Electrothrix sp.]|uniref:sulfotransferase n=1 Tax=Candidatus Electrothrix sp. TaxID=2170559 RepID=UPI004055C268
MLNFDADENQPPQVVFLTYISRSGSTFLAQILDSLHEVCVGLETRLDDGWIRGEHVCLHSESEIRAYLNQMEKDAKFRQWGVSSDEIWQRLSMHPPPIYFGDILQAALLEYAGKTSPKVLVHKCGHYISCVSKIRQEIPRAKFIFVDRDPRAIYCSQKRSIDSLTRQPMQSDIVDFALEYKKLQRSLQSVSQDPYVMVVQYEEIIASDPRAIQQKFAQFLEVDSFSVNTSNYYSTIPEAQKHLHRRVESGVPDRTRVSAWKNELPVSEILFLGWALRNWLKAKKYENCKIPIDKIKLTELFALFRHLSRYIYEAHFGRHFRNKMRDCLWKR